MHMSKSVTGAVCSDLPATNRIMFVLSFCDCCPARAAQSKWWTATSTTT